MARILIIDDESLVRNLVRATLDFGEHELIEAHDGASAIALARAAQPDLVILDLGLPGALSGREVLTAMKATHPELSFIVLTGAGDVHEAELRAAGARAYLTKPFSPLQLIAQLEDALQGAGART